MKVHLEDHVGRTQREYEIPASSTLGDLLRELEYEQHIVLVNGAFQSHNYVLNDGDVVTIIALPTGG